MKARRSLRLALARLYVPAALKRQKLAELARLTAAAFGIEPPPLGRLPWRERLLAYGRFTAGAAERALSSGADARVLQRKLFEQARPFGREVGRLLRVASLPAALEAARVLYRCLGIDLRGGPGGEIVVRRCFFAPLYTAEVCGLMSGLDSGVLAGLAGGGALRFEERLTEGGRCCRARFDVGAEP